MRTRRLFLGSLVGLVGLASAVALTAYGQDRPVAEPKYYQGKVSPAPPGMLPGTTVRQGGQPAPAPLPANSPPILPANAKTPAANPAKASPPPPIPLNPPGNSQPIAATPPANRPTRITQPVVAGPDGVYQASGSSPIPVPSLPTATLPGLTPPPPPAALPPPTITVEQPGAPSPLPKVDTTPKKVSPSVFDVPGTTAVPPAAPAVTFPAASMPQTPTPPAATTPVAPAGPQVTFPAVPPTPAPAAAPAPTAPGTSAPRTVFPEQAATPPSPAFALGTPLPSRQAPSVTVEFVAPETVGVGQTLTYELLVRNVGTSPVSNLRVEDELPTRCALVATDPSAETTGERLAWSVGTLEAGQEKRIKVTVKPADEGEIRSRAVVTFASAVDARIKVTRPKISIAVTGTEAARVGDKVQFQIQLANTGTGAASRVQLQARFSDGLTHPAGNVIEAELAALPAGQTKTLALEAIAGKSGPQSCVLTATADGGQPETAKCAVNLVEPMLLVKQTGPSSVIVRSEPVYQIELSNPGTAATDPVQVVTTLPVGFEFVQATDGGTYVETSRVVGWKMPGLPAGQTKTISLKVRSATPAEGVIRTVASATANAEAPAAPAAGVVSADHRMGAPKGGLEVRAETAVKSEGIPALRFEVSDVDDPVEVGKEAVYEIRILNQGTGPCANVQIVADLAEGTSAAGATGPTTGRVTGQQIVFDPIPQFGVKSEAVFRVRVRGDAPGEHRFRVRLVCDHIKTPVSKEENTRFYKP